MSTTFDWATSSGDTWAKRWRQTDRALGEIGSALTSAVLDAAPPQAFEALDIGCGAGATSIAVAQARSEASILACDLSPALIDIARQRAAGLQSIRFQVGDAVQTAIDNGPFDLLFSRHGVMFFADPPSAFRELRQAARGGAALVFSCFQSWSDNPWASELASAAAGRELPAPGREPSGFAFADPSYVKELLHSAGWASLAKQSVAFSYVAGEGAAPVDDALDFLADIGPASSVLRSMPEGATDAAVDRMREVLERYRDKDAVRFPAAAWIWTARAGN